MLTLACAAIATDDATQTAPDATPDNAGPTVLTRASIGPARCRAAFAAAPNCPMCALIAAYSFESPVTTTVALGGGQSTVASAFAWHEPSHSALTLQSIFPS